MSAATPPVPELDPDTLREQMVAELVSEGIACSPEVIAALRAVPRHLAVDADPAVIYDPYQVVVTRTGADGVNLSSVSGASIQALQLEQARVLPGQRVLEIGSGGVNAAYLAELVGPEGLVATVDIDPDATSRARAFLSAAGYSGVVVETLDATVELVDHGPFDAVLVTVEAVDVPDAWWHQIALGGRLVAPVRWRGLCRSVALVRVGEDLLAGDGLEQCGFVPMQGAGEERLKLLILHDEPGRRVALRVEPGSLFDEEALRAAFASPALQEWTGVTLALGESYDLLDLWLATLLDTQVMTADPGAREAGLAPSASPVGWPALLGPDSLAYRTLRATDDPQRWELGVLAHGPAREELAQRYADAVRAWDPLARPHMSVSRRQAHEPGGALTACVQRRNSTFTVSWS